MQQINLYQAQFKPKEIVLPPKQMLMVILAIIALFTIFSLYQAQQNSSLENDIP